MTAPSDDVDPAVLATMQERFAATPLHALLGLVIRPLDDARPDCAVVDMPVAPGAFGFAGDLHGGAIATLCDVACAAAASRSSSYQPTRNALVTADLHVRYLGRPKGATIRCEAEVAKSGRVLIVVEGRVLDELDTLVAVADFSAMLVDLKR